MNIHEESVTQTSYVGSISRALITFTMCWGDYSCSHRQTVFLSDA